MIQVAIPTELEPFVQGVVQNGSYSNPTEVVGDALRLLARREHLLHDVKAGVEQLDGGEYAEYDEGSREKFLGDIETKESDRYTYRVTWSAEDKEYVGLCAEFSTLSWLASSPEAALRGIRKVVADVLKDLRAHGEAIPEALASRRFSGKFMVRVPPETHRRLAIEAAEEGVSLNRLASAKLS